MKEIIDVGRMGVRMTSKQALLKSVRNARYNRPMILANHLWQEAAPAINLKKERGDKHDIRRKTTLPIGTPSGTTHHHHRQLERTRNTLRRKSTTTESHFHTITPRQTESPLRNPTPFQSRAIQIIFRRLINHQVPHQTIP